MDFNWKKSYSFSELIKKKDEEENPNNKYIYRVLDRQFEQDILSQQTISIDQLDLEGKIVSDEGLDDKTNIVQFNSDDFLVLMNIATNEKLRDQGTIDLYEVNQFGWYHSKVHSVNYKIFNENEPQKIKNIKELNPKINIKSFDLLRNDKIVHKSLNLLTGGFGLCYKVFQDEYEKFFIKIKVYDDHWRISLNDLQKNEYGIIIQLLLFSARLDHKILDQFIDIIKVKKLIIVYKYLLISFEYFCFKTFQISDFLNNLSIKSSTDSDLNKYSEDFNVLNERYVKKGMPVNFDDKFLDVTKQFIDSSKTETENLLVYFETNKLRKTTVFLLGMLHLGSRISQQFKFNNFVHAFVGLTTKYIEDIQLVKKDNDVFVDISFKEGHLIKNEIVNNYLIALKHQSELEEDLQRIRKMNEALVAEADDQIQSTDERDDDSTNISSNISNKSDEAMGSDPEDEMKSINDGVDDNKQVSSKLSDEGDEEIDKDSEQKTPPIDNNDDDSDQKRLDFPDDSNDDELNSKKTT